MNAAMRERLKAMAIRHAELEQLMAEPGALSEPSARMKIGREYTELQHIVNLGSRYDAGELELEDLKSLQQDERDPDVADMARVEARMLRTKLIDIESDIEVALLPKDATEHADAIIEVRAGAGGEEAGLFAAELMRMYQRYAQKHGWRVSLIDANETGVGGIKEAVFEIAGAGAYARLRHERGGHRVQRVPATESQGRLHTSTATVAVLPKAEELDVELRTEDLRIDIYNAGGHGGQNVNKVATAVRLTHLPTGLVVQSQRERSQNQNRMIAMEVLRSRLWDVELRKQQEAISADRRSQVGSGERSEKIRTYNFQQHRVTDHRIKFTVHNLPAVLEGELDEIVDTLIRDAQAKKLSSLGADKNRSGS